MLKFQNDGCGREKKGEGPKDTVLEYTISRN
jgi:hypothetical protein